MAAKTDPAKTDPPEQTTADDDGQADKPEARSIDARFKALEAEQASQGSKLDKILELLPGSSSSSGDDDGDDASEPTQRHNIGAEVRRQIAESEKRRRDEDREAGLDTWRKGVDETLEKLKPEKPPRAPQTRLQRLLYGRDE